MRITAAQRTENENRIRTVMDRLLRGEILPGGRCDIKTLAIEADVDRTAFYGTRPYSHLREEFEHRLQALQQAGAVTDPREARIARLKAEVTALKERLARSADTIDELTDFRSQASPGSPPSTTRSSACAAPPTRPAASPDSQRLAHRSIVTACCSAVVVLLQFNNPGTMLGDLAVAHDE
jgi:hypothetical protein